jgi:DNA-binding transcriptional MerR regulator
MTVDGVGLSIGQVAERTGLSVHTLRFYEREGLLITPVQRAGNGQRVYAEDDVSWLTGCVLMLRATDMSLPDIRRYTELARLGDDTEAERLAMLRRHERRVAERIHELGEALDLVRFKVGLYEDSLAEA